MADRFVYRAALSEYEGPNVIDCRTGHFMGMELA